MQYYDRVPRKVTRYVDRGVGSKYVILYMEVLEFT